MAYHHSPSIPLSNYHTSVAAGGIGMTTVAYAAIDQGGLSLPNQLWLRKGIIPELKSMTSRIHAQGALASIQIGHCGSMTKLSIAGQVPISTNYGINLYVPTWVRGIDQDDIMDIASYFGQAVRIAREAGFDAVEVQAGHGYLISQFLSPYTNRRKDKYGGSLDNRMRLMKLCIHEVMKAAGGDMAVVVKMNMRDGFKGGMELEESLEVARTLEQCGVHGLILSGGFVSKAPMYAMRGTMPMRTLSYYSKDKWLQWAIRLAGKWMLPTVDYTPCYFLEDALRFRQVISIPLIYVGGLTNRTDIDRVLSHGFEAVAMARALVNEPDFVNKMKHGAPESGCCHSNYCIARM